MKTFEKWLVKSNYEFKKEVIMNGERVVFKFETFTVDMYRTRRGGYLTYHETGKKIEFYSVKEIIELAESLLNGRC